jgi:hypothetical protein
MALGGHLLPAVSDDLLIARNADAIAVTPPGCLISRLLSKDRYARSHGKMTFPAATSRR